jgi:hypothetical protein
MAKGRKKRKKTSPPTKPWVKWTGKEEECLAEAWKTVSMNGITDANQNFDTYWQRVKTAFDERKLVDPYFNKTVMVPARRPWPRIGGSCRRRATSGTAYKRRSPIVRLAASTLRPRYSLFSVDIGSPICDDASFSVQMRRAFNMYGDDFDGQQFKYLNVFARIEDCEKWAEVRRTLSKNKDEQYNPDAPAAAASAGRPEFNQKKLKEMKKSGPPADRLQASFEKCWADARAHNAGRDTKYDARWK